MRIYNLTKNSRLLRKERSKTQTELQRKRDVMGFSLAEIIMVIIIIALMAAIVVPRFSRGGDQAEIAQTKANLESIRIAISLYNSEEGNYPMLLSQLMDGSAPSGTRYMPSIPFEGVEASNNVVYSPDYLGGWYWDNVAFRLVPNLPGVDANGDPYSGY